MRTSRCRNGTLLDGLGGVAGLIVLPMPMGNYGLRFSIKAKRETTKVMNWGTFDFPG